MIGWHEITPSLSAMRIIPALAALVLRKRRLRGRRQRLGLLYHPVLHT
jgi:hypothetical protein